MLCDITGVGHKTVLYKKETPTANQYALCFIRESRQLSKPAGSGGP